MTIQSHDIKQAVQLLQAGRLVAFPTETVYGLGADATNDRAVAAIYEAKERPDFNPLIAHVATVNAARALGRFNTDARKLADAFWPGALTLVVPRAERCPVSLLVSAGMSNLALRVPEHPLAHELITRTGRPIAAPSANRSGRISPTTPEHVLASLDGRIDMVLDGGVCGIGLESTIVSCLEDTPVLLRPGGITREAIEDALDMRLARPRGKDGAPVAPGQLASHYAPEAALRMNATWFEEAEAVLAFGPDVPVHSGMILNLSESGSLNETAANLFAMLHELDACGAESIAVMPIPPTGVGLAINDRLKRASTGRRDIRDNGELRPV
ncbi:MAG: L-threonylcarbamoyladenylate synthase [Aestuariivirgaceae bacterium]